MRLALANNTTYIAPTAFSYGTPAWESGDLCYAGNNTYFYAYPDEATGSPVCWTWTLNNGTLTEHLTGSFLTPPANVATSYQVFVTHLSQNYVVLVMNATNFNHGNNALWLMLLQVNSDSVIVVSDYLLDSTAPFGFEMLPEYIFTVGNSNTVVVGHGRGDSGQSQHVVRIDPQSGTWTVLQNQGGLGSLPLSGAGGTYINDSGFVLFQFVNQAGYYVADYCFIDGNVAYYDNALQLYGVTQQPIPFHSSFPNPAPGNPYWTADSAAFIAPAANPSQFFWKGFEVVQLPETDVQSALSAQGTYPIFGPIVNSPLWNGDPAQTPTGSFRENWANLLPQISSTAADIGNGKGLLVVGFNPFNSINDLDGNGDWYPGPGHDLQMGVLLVAFDQTATVDASSYYLAYPGGEFGVVPGYNAAGTNTFVFKIAPDGQGNGMIMYGFGPSQNAYWTGVFQGFTSGVAAPKWSIGRIRIG